MNEIEVLWLGEGWNGLEKHDYVSLPVSEDNVEISYREQSDATLKDLDLTRADRTEHEHLNSK
jgi:hypothetical protein